jgi:hypothetical protein
MRRFGGWLLVAGLSLAVVAGCRKKKRGDEPELPTVQGSGVGSFQSRQLVPFSRLDAGGALEVTVNVGKNAPLELRGDDNLFAHVPSTVVGDELVLKPDSVLKTTQPLRLVVGTERLEAVTVAVGASVAVHGVKADTFTVRMGGAGKLVLDGSSQTLKLSARSLAQCDLTAFSAGTATVGASDLSRVKLGYLEKLDATQSGHALIAYRGTPEVTRHAERPENVAAAN